MKKTTIAATATGLLLGSTALAGPVEDIVAQFQTYGYDSIEISQTGDLVKIEGVRGGTEREIVFDTATNTILKDETGPAGDDEDDDGEVDDDEDDDNEDDEGDDNEDDEGDDNEDDEGDDNEDDEEDDS